MSEGTPTAGAAAPGRADRVAGALALAFSAAVAALYVSPKVLDPDEAIVGAVARRMLELHLPVYEAGWDHKPPLLFWIYRTLFALFGAYDYVAVHVVSAAAWVTTGVLVGIGARRLLGARAFAPAVVAYTLLRSMHSQFAGAANFEAFMSPLLAASMLLLLSSRDGVRVRLAGGSLLAAAALMKPQVAVFGVCAVVATALVRGRGAAWRTAWTGLVAAAVVFGAAAAVLWATGDLAGAWTCNVEMQLAYASHGRIEALGPRLATLASQMAAEPAPWAFVACGLVAALAFPARFGEPRAVRRWAAAALVFLACGLFLVTQGGYFFRHYWWMVHPFAAVAVAAGWDALVCAPPPGAARWAGRAAAVAIGVLLWLPAHRADKRHLVQDLRRDRFGRTELAPVADAVRRLTPGGEPIWVWGWNPQLYVAADRRAATRFIVCYPLTGSFRFDVATGRAPPQPDLVPGAWDRLVADLDAEKPRVIVDTTGAGYFDWSRFPVAAFPRLAGYLVAHYDRAADVKGYALYVRRGE